MQKLSESNYWNSVQTLSMTQYNMDEFSQPFSETIAKIAKNNCAYYVLGDININLVMYHMIAEHNSMYAVLGAALF